MVRYFYLMIRYLFVLLWCCSCSLLQAQDPVIPPVFPVDTALGEVPMTPNDYTGFWRGDYPNPRKALLMSFILPGSGQAYNRKWWKIPLVYATLGGLTWLEVNNYNFYKGFRDNYKWAVDGDPGTNPIDEPYISLDATDLKYYRDQSRRTLEQSSLVLGLAYLLVATDAFVDAHLASFDVSDDLSFKLVPKAQMTPGWGPSYGLGISIPLGGTAPPRP
ncbi:MAG: hypothetical protein IPL65_12990 [Lewinellaceae bacterium]|nr:hypothetical protein [Lewinellaceae bacterium]